MFTINIYLRLSLTLLCLAGGALLASRFGFWYAFPIILIGLILGIGYLLFGTVQSTAEFVQKMDIPGAEKRLALTLSPKLLLSFNRAYYYMLKGTIATHKKDIKSAEKFFQLAQQAGLPGQNENAMILLQQASIAASKQNWQKAKTIMREIKKMKITEPALKDQIKELEKAINQSGRIKAMQRQGRFGMHMNKKMKRRKM